MTTLNPRGVICMINLLTVEFYHILKIFHKISRNLPYQYVRTILYFYSNFFLAHLTWPQVSYCHHWASVVCCLVVRPLTFHILINFSNATGPIWTKLWWNGPLMVPFQNCVGWPRPPTKMAAVTKNRKFSKKSNKNLLLKNYLAIWDQTSVSRMVLRWSPFRIVFDNPGRQLRWSLLLKIENSAKIELKNLLLWNCLANLDQWLPWVNIVLT